MFSNHHGLRPELHSIEDKRALAFRADGRTWTADDMMNDAGTTGADVDGSVELEAVLTPRKGEAKVRFDPHGAAAIPHGK